MTGDTLNVLLIEDNPGDARLVDELLHGGHDLLHRLDVDGSGPERVAVQHELNLSAGLAYLDANEVDVILLDLGLPDSEGLRTLATALDETRFTPIIVLTGLDDRDRGIEAIKRGAHDYLVKDDVTGELLVHSIRYALEQTRQERERVRYRERLEALSQLNTITQEITHDVITTSSREDLERAVCERLVDSTPYSLAWIGELDRRNSELSPRLIAGRTETTEEFTISLEEPIDRPEAQAATTREVSVAQQIEADVGTDSTTVGSYRSVAAVPVAYRSLFYGILVIYADSPTALSDHETEILSRLGDVIGHGITSVERKKALASDSALQLEFRLRGVAEELVSLSAARDGSIAFADFIRRDSGLLVYGQATSIPREQFRSAAQQSPLIEDLRFLESGKDGYKFEFRTQAVAPLDSALLSHGGRVASGRIDSGQFRFVVEFPQGRDKRQLIDLVETNCEGATLSAHRTVQHDNPSVPDSKSIFQNRLTDKQKAALEAAYHSGYFEWPRAISGGELAELLGITQATFSQHFRAAERAFFSAIFEGDEERQLSSPWQSSESAPESTE